MAPMVKFRLTFSNLRVFSSVSCMFVSSPSSNEQQYECSYRQGDYYYCEEFCPLQCFFKPVRRSGRARHLMVPVLDRQFPSDIKR
jgi:hypothetical protein